MNFVYIKKIEKKSLTESDKMCIMKEIATRSGWQRFWFY